MTIYERSCRLCLKDLLGPGIDCLTITELNDAINILFDVKIQYSDITRCICNKCFENVMGYKAFKKTISECQAILRDYELIRKKVIANHQRISIKEEIIDLSEEIAASAAAAAVTNPKQNNRKRPVANSVTDSQIHNILNIVHDKATPNGSNWDTSTPVNANKKAKLCIPMIIKTEPVTETTPPPTPVIENIIQQQQHKRISEEPNSTVTSTSNDKLVSSNLINNATTNILPANDKRSESTCSTSTSGIASDVTQNKDNSSQKILLPEPIDGINGKVQARTNDLINHKEQTADGVNNNDDDDSSFNKTTRLKAMPICKKEPKYRKSIASNSVNDENGLNTTNSSATSLQQENPGNVTLTEDVYPCPECPMVFKLRYRFNQHLEKIHKYVSEEINKLGPVKRLKTPTGQVERARSVRHAKSQALKKFSPVQPKRSNSSSPNGIRRSVTKNNNTEKVNTPNQKSTPATTASGDIASIDDCKKPIAGINNANPDVKVQPIENGTFNGKRIITITLLRTKNSVNFRYCDQHKQHIDFNTVTPEELEDIRNSLMLPEIWGNLKGVFKDSPPDKKTIDQLKTIFGENFPM